MQYRRYTSAPRAGLGGRCSAAEAGNTHSAVHTNHPADNRFVNSEDMNPHSPPHQRQNANMIPAQSE
jgi:hypothetical protein